MPTGFPRTSRRGPLHITVNCCPASRITMFGLPRPIWTRPGRLPTRTMRNIWSPTAADAPLKRAVPCGGTKTRVEIRQAGEPFMAQRREQRHGTHGFEAVTGGEDDVPAGIPADDLDRKS